MMVDIKSAACVSSGNLTNEQISVGAAVLCDHGQPIGRNAAIEVFDAMRPTDIERALAAEIAELRANIEGMRKIGALMANTMFNLGQRPGTMVDQRLADSMREIQRDWDVAVRTTSTAVEHAACTCPSGDGSLRWPCPAHAPACVLTLPIAIMHLPCKPGRAISMHGASKQAYQEGHRDARHAAADLVLERADELAALAVSTQKGGAA